jgi:DNA polymerase-3 subunit epsilon
VIGGRGWELLAVRHGRFSGSTLVPASKDPLPFARSLAMTGTGEADLAAPLCHGYHQEAEILLTWLEGEGVRTVLCEGDWQVPARARFETEHLARRFALTADAQEA